MWRLHPTHLLGGASDKESPCQCGRRGDTRDASSIPGSGSSPGGGNGSPLQYSCMENPMDKGAWWASIHGAVKSRTRLSNWAPSHTQVKILPSLSLMHTYGRRSKGPPQGSPGLWEGENLTNRRTNDQAGSQSGQCHSLSPPPTPRPALDSHACPRVQGRPAIWGRTVLLLGGCSDSSLPPPKTAPGSRQGEAAVGVLPMQGRSRAGAYSEPRKGTGTPTPLCFFPGVT